MNQYMYSLSFSLYQVKRQEANKAYKEEQDRQIEELEHLTPAEIEQRLSIASKLMEVQKQLLETHQPAKVSNSKTYIV